MTRRQSRQPCQPESRGCAAQFWRSLHVAESTHCPPIGDWIDCRPALFSAVQNENRVRFGHWARAFFEPRRRSYGENRCVVCECAERSVACGVLTQWIARAALRRKRSYQSSRRIERRFTAGLVAFSWKPRRFPRAARSCIARKIGIAGSSLNFVRRLLAPKQRRNRLGDTLGC